MAERRPDKDKDTPERKDATAKITPVAPAPGLDKER